MRTARTSFVGRAAELNDLEALVNTGRLVTILGVGGAGKTRLAAELADRRRRAGLTTVLVELATLVPDRVATAVAAAVGADPAAGDLIGAIAATIDGTDALLVLDNCEHVLDAAARLVDELLDATSVLRVVATSREPLRIAGEVSWSIPPLAITSEAADLFVARAREARPQLELDDDAMRAVPELCRRLDGLPLAIELAAARVRTMPLADLAANLDRRFRLLTGGSRVASRRQQTLQGCLDWSYELLSPAEQAAFRRLAVFAGGFTVAAAERVIVAPPVARDDVLSLVLSLVDKSMLQVGEDGRYGFLETLRDYGLLQLVAADEATATRDAHFAWAASLVDDDPELGPSSPTPIPLRFAEADNLRAAFEWAIESDDLASAVATDRRTSAMIGLALTTLESTNGAPSLAAAIAARTMQATEPGTLARLRLLRVQIGAAAFAADMARLDELRPQVESELPLAVDPRQRWLAHDALATSIPFDFGAKRPMLRAALALAHEIGDAGLVQRSKNSLALAEAQVGRWREASDLLAGDDSVAPGIAVRVAILNGRLREAADLATDAELVTEIDLRATPLLGMWTYRLSQTIRVELLRGRDTEHLDALHRMLDIARRLGYRDAVLNSGWVEGTWALTHGDTDAGVQRLVAWRDELRTVGATHAALPNVVEALLAAGAVDDARDEVAAQLAIASADSIQASRLTTQRAAIDHVAGDLEAARTTLASAIGTQNDEGWRIELVDSIELAAVLTDEPRLVLRLAGGASALRDNTDYRLRWPHTAGRLDEAVAAARAELGADAAADAAHHGRTLDETALVAVALETLRPRGRSTGRRHPSDLTPTEAQVEALAVRGLTNREIADQLLMGVETVKTHLSRIFDKRGVRTRRDLARLADSTRQVRQI